MPDGQDDHAAAVALDVARRVQPSPSVVAASALAGAGSVP
jgi:hypothetical protein